MKEILTTKGKVAIVDDADFAWLSQMKWYAKEGTRTFYAVTMVGRRHVPMHRLIMGSPKGKDIDHINGDGLDNRRSNLRVCSRSENLMNRGASPKNTSGFKGVSWNEATGSWRAKIQRRGQSIHIGLFQTKEAAAIAYNKTAEKLFKQFAKLNPITEQI